MSFEELDLKIADGNSKHTDTYTNFTISCTCQNCTAGNCTPLWTWLQCNTTLPL